MQSWSKCWKKNLSLNIHKKPRQQHVSDTSSRQKVIPLYFLLTPSNPTKKSRRNDFLIISRFSLRAFIKPSLAQMSEHLPPCALQLQLNKRTDPFLIITNKKLTQKSRKENFDISRSNTKKKLKIHPNQNESKPDFSSAPSRADLVRLAECSLGNGWVKMIIKNLRRNGYDRWTTPRAGLMVPRKRPLATWLRFSGVGNFHTYVFFRGEGWRLRGLSLYSLYKYGKNRRRVARNWSWQGNLAGEGRTSGQMLTGPWKGEKDSGRNNCLELP